MKQVMIFCDGACSGNGKETNIGGWGAVLKYKDQIRECFGGSPETTNNVMELTAAIEALKCLNSKEISVSVYSDSAYVVNCFQNGWYHKWKMNGWMTAKKEPVENKALWQELIGLVESFSEVRFFKVKGHLDLNKASDLAKWHKKFIETNRLQISIDAFKTLTSMNHLADELANKGIDSVRNPLSETQS
jgi:ribonuclease HI